MFKAACGTVFKSKEAQKIISLLKEENKSLTVKEISEKTGISEIKVKRTLRMLKIQMNMAEKRNSYLKERE